MKASELKEGRSYLRQIGKYEEEIKINRIDERRDWVSFTPNTGKFKGRKETELNLAYVAHTIVREVG